MWWWFGLAGLNHCKKFGWIYVGLNGLSEGSGGGRG